MVVAEERAAHDLDALCRDVRLQPLGPRDRREQEGARDGVAAGAPSSVRKPSTRRRTRSARARARGALRAACSSSSLAASTRVSSTSDARASGRRPLAEPAGGQRPVVEVGDVQAHEVEVAGEPQVLKAVVEHVDAAAEAGLDGAADHVAPAADRDDDTGQGPREHDGLVARLLRRGGHRAAVADDERVAAEAAAVAAAEHRHRRAGLAEHLGHERARPASCRSRPR